MNKLVILVGLLAAFAACATATGDEEVEDYSQLTIMPTDDVETAGLLGENQILSDYCIQSRDEIQKFIGESVNGAAASVFDAFFSSATDIGTQVLRAQSSAVEEAAAMIRESAVEQPKDEVVSKEEVKENLEKNVENLSMLQVVSQAAKVVVNSVIETAKTQLFGRVAMLRAKFDGEVLKDKVTEACGSITFNLQPRLSALLSSTKSSIKQSLGKTPAQQGVLDAINRARADNVPCVSTGRVAKIARFCDILRMAGPTIFPLLGM